MATKIAAGEFDGESEVLVCHTCSYYSICPEQEVASAPPASSKPN